MFSVGRLHSPIVKSQGSTPKAISLGMTISRWTQKLAIFHGGPVSRERIRHGEKTRSEMAPGLTALLYLTVNETPPVVMTTETVTFTNACVPSGRSQTGANRCLRIPHLLFSTSRVWDKCLVVSRLAVTARGVAMGIFQSSHTHPPSVRIHHKMSACQQLF